MNRSDEIQAVARDIAQRVTCDPEQRNAMADDLIKLVSLVVAAVGKSVAIAGESGLNEALSWEFELDTESIDYTPEEVASREAEFAAEQREESIKCHGMYLTGERIQEGAEWVQNEACGADLERYEEGGGKPVWVPKAACEGVSTCTGIHNLRGKHLRDRPVPKFTGCPDPSDDGELDDGWEGPYDESFEDLYREAPNDNFDGPRCPALLVGYGRCTKRAGHRLRGSDDPHTYGCPDLFESGTPCGQCAPDDDEPCCPDSLTSDGCRCPALYEEDDDVVIPPHVPSDERCGGCGEPRDNGQVHGPNQGYGGCV